MPSSPDPERTQVEEAVEWFNSQDWHYMTEPRLGVLAKAAERWLAGSSPDYEAAGLSICRERDHDHAFTLNRGCQACVVLAKEAVAAAFPDLFEERP